MKRAGVSLPNQSQELYATMVFEMRTDAFEKSQLPKKLVKERLPFAM
jgi:hypothetical protein